MKLHTDMWRVFSTYLLTEKKYSGKPAALQATKSHFRKVVRYFHNKDFNRQNFNEFIAGMREKKYATAYLNKMITIGKHIDKFLNINAIQDYSYFFEKKSITLEILTPSEIEKMAKINIPYKKHCRYLNKRQKLLILLLGTTGCRIGEALSLKFSDIHTSPAYVIFRETKNGDDRIVPISQSLFKEILNLPRKNEFVFSSGRGGKLELQQVNLDMKKRAKACGIKKRVWCHLFRHSYITTMLEQGVDISDIAVIVGHRDVNTTMHYKNSLLTHYIDVVHAFPLLRGEISWEQLSQKICTFISKAVDTRHHSLKMKERNDKLVIEVEKIT